MHIRIYLLILNDGSLLKERIDPHKNSHATPLSMSFIPPNVGKKRWMGHVTSRRVDLSSRLAESTCRQLVHSYAGISDDDALKYDAEPRHVFSRLQFYAADA